MGSDAAQVEFPDGNEVRKYTPAEEQRLSEHLFALDERVHAGEFRSEPPSILFFQRLHREFFKGIRDGHAGRCRRPGWGATRLTFGPNESTDRNDVETELDNLIVASRRYLNTLESSTNDPTYEANALKLAAWMHAEIIRIHPFEDGNGRISRLIMNIMLFRLGLRPIAIEACKQEYLSVMNDYLKTKKDLRPLCDLLLRNAT